MGLVAGPILSIWSSTASSASTPTLYTLPVAAVIAAAIAAPAPPGPAAAGGGVGTRSLLHGILALRVARLSSSLLRWSTLRGQGSAKRIATS
jgi:hypothetical protein